jgi:16S rRNA (uracil1498-N3)-methyltransferase
MKRQRFIGQFDLDQDTIVSADRELANQIRNVFRLSPGDQVLLCDGRGGEAVGRIESGPELVFSIIERKPVRSDPPKEITLYCSILKRENFEMAAQKATECGVLRIVPVISSRTIKTGLKSDRLNKIIKEASEQCGRSILPEVGATLTLDQALEEAAANDVNYFFDGSGAQFTPALGQKIGIFIGPEGGFTEEELRRAGALGCRISKLGNLTLRAETAAIVASYLSANNE